MNHLDTLQRHALRGVVPPPFAGALDAATAIDPTTWPAGRAALSAALRDADAGVRFAVLLSFNANGYDKATATLLDDPDPAVADAAAAYFVSLPPAAPAVAPAPAAPSTADRLLQRLVAGGARLLAPAHDSLRDALLLGRELAEQLRAWHAGRIRPSLIGCFSSGGLRLRVRIELPAADYDGPEAFMLEVDQFDDDCIVCHLPADEQEFRDGQWTARHCEQFASDLHGGAGALELQRFGQSTTLGVPVMHPVRCARGRLTLSLAGSNAPIEAADLDSVTLVLAARQPAQFTGR